MRKCEEEKVKLDRKKKLRVRTLIRSEGRKSPSPCNNLILEDALKKLDKEHAKLFEDITLEKDVRLKDIDTMIEAEEKKVREEEAIWMEGVGAWLSSGLSLDLHEQVCNTTYYDFY